MTDTTRPAESFAIRVENLGVNLGDLTVLAQVNLTVTPGEFVALVGPSGCGKSTLLNILAGLLQPNHGTATTAQPCAYMPQRDALLPWRTIIENAVLPAEICGSDLNIARARARELLPAFGLDGFGDHYPHSLSGGMRQRAAFLRTVLSERSILLLDEPFGALDALTRREMQDWLLHLWASLARSVLMVTHDVEEALLLADRVAIMSARPGRIRTIESVELPRPRDPEMIAAPVFVEQKMRLLALLRSEIGSLAGSFPAPAEVAR